MTPPTLRNTPTGDPSPKAPESPTLGPVELVVHPDRSLMRAYVKAFVLDEKISLEVGDSLSQENETNTPAHIKDVLEGVNIVTDAKNRRTLSIEQHMALTHGRTAYPKVYVLRVIALMERAERVLPHERLEDIKEEMDVSKSAQLDALEQEVVAKESGASARHR